ncbi:hypothetical protein B0H14DRAFT_2569378 [Mycena olivaceomarginata]|nr:hypothetical protein B0H14DRAFT_2569378 [Mycena olivaceomarginata]
MARHLPTRVINFIEKYRPIRGVCNSIENIRGKETVDMDSERGVISDRMALVRAVRDIEGGYTALRGGRAPVFAACLPPEKKSGFMTEICLMAETFMQVHNTFLPTLPWPPNMPTWTRIGPYQRSSDRYKLSRRSDGEEINADFPGRWQDLEALLTAKRHAHPLELVQ